MAVEKKTTKTNKPPRVPQPRSVEHIINRWGPEMRAGKKTSSAKNVIALDYPFFRTQLFPQPQLQFDQNRIPVTVDASAKKLYDAGLIVSYGLWHIAAFVEDGEIPSRHEAIRICNWLIENLVEWRTHIFAWPDNKPLPFYKIKAPTVSAKTHGMALSLLLRIAYIENDAWYEETAKQIVRLYFLPVEEGGLVRQLKSGGLAFDEFATATPTVPLFGNLYSLIGLAEYAAYFEDPDVRTILRGGLRGLKELLPKYDTGKWVLFDLHPCRRCASANEIRKRCALLELLSTRSEDSEYAAYAQKWRGYLETFANKRYYFFQRLWEPIRLRFLAKKLGIDIKYRKDAPR